MPLRQIPADRFTILRDEADGLTREALEPLHWADWGLVAVAGGLAGLFAAVARASLREPHHPR